MKKTTVFFIIFISILFVSILVLAYINYFSSKKILSSPTIIKDTNITPTAVITPVTDPTSDFKTYVGKNFTYSNNVYSGYSFNYPDTCTLKNETLTCTLKNSVVTLQINAGGHGGGEGNYKILIDNQTKIIDSVEGKLTAIEDLDNKIVFGTYWINKTPNLVQEPIFGFEFYGLSSSDFNEFKTLFELLLSTFKFTDDLTSFSSKDLTQGWYWGFENQKKINTPTDWVFTEAGKSSCWHSPDKNCSL